MKAGWARIDMTPTGSVPLAGYAHLRDRMSTRVRDPLFIRALALEDGGRRVLFLACDLLLVSEDLFTGLKSRLSETHSHLIVHATHTHSSLGGFWDALPARFMMGAFRPSALPWLLDAGERAARAALADLAPATVGSASRLVPGLNGNRRDPAGPKDEELTVLSLKREHDSAIVASYSAHPVIVAELDHHAISADFPGEVVRRIEAAGPFAMFVQGSLGGVDVLFWEDRSVSLDDNLARMAEPLATTALELARSTPPSTRGLRFASAEFELGRPDSRPFFDDEPLKALAGLPLKWLLDWLFSVRGMGRGRVQGMAVGDFAFVGTPSDLGVGIGLDIKAHARSAGIPHPAAGSQTDGYIGYLHRREDYRKAPPERTLGMARYENAMGIFGRDMGDHVRKTACDVLDRLAADRRP